jgi:7-cyano-7-deazaguanine synthase
VETAVLLSAGLDSAVLAALEARSSRVHPVYVSTGLAWEPEELAALDRLLAAPPYASVAPLATLTFTVRDLYPPSHWALRGEPPAFDTPDEDVYLTGRNVILLTKAAIYCAQQRIGRIVIGPLAGNPFPDATPEFFATMARALSLGLARDIRIDAPFADKEK